MKGVEKIPRPRIRISKEAYKVAEKLSEKEDTTISRIASVAIKEYGTARGEYEKVLSYLGRKAENGEI